jgi:transmembrane sensor
LSGVYNVGKALRPDNMIDATTQEEAAHWFAALRRGPMSLGERAQFDAWRAHPANQRALDAMHELWGEVSAIKTLGAPHLRRSRLRPAAAAAAAAVFVLAAGGLAVVLATAPEAQAHIQTKIGEQQTRTLPDGSIVAMNVVTSLNYKMRATERAVALEDGEATFFVKKSAGQPFVVTVGDYQVRADGTTFDVRLRDGVMDVSVAQGVVDISAPQGASVVRLAAGKSVQLAAYSPAGPPVDLTKATIKPVDTRQFAEWRLRTVTYEDIPVSTVIEDLNRYYGKPVDVVDAGLAQRRVTIHLQVEARDETLQTLAALLGAAIQPGEHADTIVPTPAAAG